MLATKVVKIGYNGVRRIGYGRLTFAVFLLLFFFGPLFLQQNAIQAKEASVKADKAKSLKRKKCRDQLSMASFQRRLMTAKVRAIAPPPAPVRRVGFAQVPGGDKYRFECDGEDCVSGTLRCKKLDSHIMGSGCCARCCWDSYPNICSQPTCCGDEPEIQ